MKVITFSRTFPASHPKVGQPTWFVEKIWKSLWELTNFQGIGEYEAGYQEVFPVGNADEENIHFHKPKFHTIRSGKRWKEGESFSPRVWSGRPYNSKQIPFAPPILITKVFNIKIWPHYEVFINGQYIGSLGFGEKLVQDLAQNDGLTEVELYDWLGSEKGFDGQIICWNPDIDYSPIKDPARKPSPKW